jgi:hypothetical protein
LQPRDRHTALTAEELRRLLVYEPETVVFRWRVARPNGVRIGDVAGSLSLSTGYWLIKINGKRYQAARLAWLYMAGQWPTDRIDHEDLNKANNRWGNLRAATFKENSRNRAVHRNKALAVKGVFLSSNPRRTKPYRAMIRVDGDLKSLGYYATADEAHAAYSKAAHEHFGDFARI